MLGTITLGLSAIALIGFPRLFTDLLGLTGTSDVDWSMQMIGVTLVALCLNMAVHALKGSDQAVIWVARVMQLSAFSLGVTTLFIPSGINWFVISYALVGFGFSASYMVYLLQRPKE